MTSSRIDNATEISFELKSQSVLLPVTWESVDSKNDKHSVVTRDAVDSLPNVYYGDEITLKCSTVGAEAVLKIGLFWYEFDGKRLAIDMSNRPVEHVINDQFKLIICADEWDDFCFFSVELAQKSQGVQADKQRPTFVQDNR